MTGAAASSARLAPGFRACSASAMARGGKRPEAILDFPDDRPGPLDEWTCPHGEVAVRAPRTRRESQARQRRVRVEMRAGGRCAQLAEFRQVRVEVAQEIGSLEPPVAEQFRVERRDDHVPALCALRLAHLIEQPRKVARVPCCLTTRVLGVIRPLGAQVGAGSLTRHSLRPPGQRILWNSRYGAAPGYPPCRLHTCADERGSRTSAATSRAALSSVTRYASYAVRRGREPLVHRVPGHPVRLAVEHLAVDA